MKRAIILAITLIGCQDNYEVTLAPTNTQLVFWHGVKAWKDLPEALLSLDRVDDVVKDTTINVYPGHHPMTIETASITWALHGWFEEPNAVHLRRFESEDCFADGSGPHELAHLWQYKNGLEVGHSEAHEMITMIFERQSRVEWCEKGEY